MAAQDLSINDLAALPVYEGSGIPAARFYDGSGSVRFFGHQTQDASSRPVETRQPIAGIRGRYQPPPEAPQDKYDQGFRVSVEQIPNTSPALWASPANTDTVTNGNEPSAYMQQRRAILDRWHRQAQQPETGMPTTNPDNPLQGTPLPSPRQNASRSTNVSAPSSGQRSGLADSLFSLFYGRRGIGSKALGPGVGSLPSADTFSPPQNHIGPDGSPRPQFAPKQNLSAGLTYSSGRTYDLPTPGMQSPGINRSY